MDAVCVERGWEKENSLGKTVKNTRERERHSSLESEVKW